MGTSFESLTQLPRPFGPFTLIRLIAQGGMGQVFLALRPVEGEPTDEVCVVKTVRTDLKHDREAVGRFLDEARVVQKLDHAAICHTLDAGVVDKSYYLAMEFISGRNLRDVQTRAQKLGRPLPDALIFHSLTEVLAALDYAHKLVDKDTREPLNIVHRDVSPHNLMLGFDGYVKLIDFGLAAHVLKRELTRPGIMVGKLRYNAPEQVRDRALDGRSDLYSVGVMLYELVVGERFYEGLSEEDIWRVAMKGTYRPRAWSAVPADLKAILELALTPFPEERFATAAHMRDAVIEAARTRNVRDARRACARFMGEIFADERQTERDMILQATGLAEARTRLFAAPELSESLHPDPLDHRPEVSSVGRTNVVSPAQLRGRLHDLVSMVDQSFDPNAETVLPSQPILDEMSRLSVSGSDAFARSGRDVGPARGGQGNPFRSLEDTLVGEEGEAGKDVVDPAQTVAARSLSRRGDANLRPALNATMPSLPRNVRQPSREAAQPLPPLPPAPRPGSAGTPRTPRAPGVTSPTGTLSMRESPSPALIVGGVILFFLVLGVAALIALPPLLAGEPRPIRPAPGLVVDAPGDGAGPDRAPAGVDAGAAPAVVVAPGPPDGAAGADAPPGVDGANGVDGATVAATAPETSSTTDPSAAADAGGKVHVDPVHVEQGDKVHVDKTTKPAGEKIKVPKGERRPPPPGEMRTLRDQVDYLRRYCVERVACARSTTESAASIATLSPDETKQLIAEIPRCIARCQR